MKSILFTTALFAGAFAAPSKYYCHDGQCDSYYHDAKYDNHNHNWGGSWGGKWSGEDKKACDKDMKCNGQSDCPQGGYKFTSTFFVEAFPDQVVNVTTPTGGLPVSRTKVFETKCATTNSLPQGSYSSWDMGFNSETNQVCWYIVSKGFQGEYSSAAATATHVHEGDYGMSGPPRLSLMNPAGSGDVRISSGCQTGPFVTGLDDTVTGIDTGADFHVGELEADPAAYYVDIHSSLAVPGANRGQFA